MDGAYGNISGSADWGPPPGYIAALQQSGAANLAGIAQLGSFAGQVGAGAVGAVQGSQDPTVFGSGTSATGGGARGFLQNFAAAGNGGSQGGQGGNISGFANMVNGRGGQGGSGTPSVKQLQLASKTADAFRAQMQSDPSLTEDQKSKMLGVDDDTWSTLGAAQKQGVMSSFVQSNVQKLAASKIMDFYNQGIARKAQADEAQTASDFYRNYQIGVSNAKEALPDGSSAKAINDYAKGYSIGMTKGPIGRVIPPIISDLDRNAAAEDASANGTQPPTPYTSPNGNNYITRGNEMLRDDKPAPQKLTVKTVPILDKVTGQVIGSFPEYSGPQADVEAANSKYNDDLAAKTAAKNAPVQMVDPTGQKVMVPANQVNTAKQKGYK